MKKLVFTAVALIAFSGVTLANNKLGSTNAVDLMKVASITDQQVQEDAWFCYKASETSSYNPMNQETTITTTYICTWHDLSVAAISQE